MLLNDLVCRTLAYFGRMCSPKEAFLYNAPWGEILTILVSVAALVVVGLCLFAGGYAISKWKRTARAQSRLCQR
jgi:hypothetical protein